MVVHHVCVAVDGVAGGSMGLVAEVVAVAMETRRVLVEDWVDQTLISSLYGVEDSSALGMVLATVSGSLRVELGVPDKPVLSGLLGLLGVGYAAPLRKPVVALYTSEVFEYAVLKVEFLDRTTDVGSEMLVYAVPVDEAHEAIDQLPGNGYLTLVRWGPPREVS